MKRTIEIRTSRFLRWCHQTSTSWSTTTGCGSRGGRPPGTSPPPLQVMDRLYAWWAALVVWSSGGDYTRTWRGPLNSHHFQTCIYSNSASSQCGRIPPTLMEANGWSDYAKRRQGARGKTSAWQCSENSSWWGLNCAAWYCQCASRTTTWRCGTGRRRTWRRRRECVTLSGASSSCRRPCRSSTKPTAIACARLPLVTTRSRRPRPSQTRRAPSPTPTLPLPSHHRQQLQFNSNLAQLAFTVPAKYVS